MKIVHLCLQAPYNDYWGYQDNLLPKYQKKQGYDVTVITTNTEHNNGSIVQTEEKEYVLNDNEKIIRIAYSKKIGKISNLIKWFNISDLLNSENPDFIFVHGLGNVSVIQAAKYAKRNKNVVLVADNHVDYYNESPQLKGNKFKSFIIRITLKLLNKYMQKFYKKVYGVTPWRVQYQQDVFGISKEKSDLLVLGADDEKIDYEHRKDISNLIRNNLKIPKDAFVVISGGKIDKSKNVSLLSEAVCRLGIDKVYLVIFGNIDPDVEVMINRCILTNKQIIKIGWIDASEVYNYFLASDLAAFPGTHSVLWEQACACGIPVIFKKWDGMQHVDVGGNSVFIEHDSVDEIENVLKEIIGNRKKYEHMKMIAENNGRNTFLYSKIAEKSLEAFQ